MGRSKPRTNKRPPPKLNRKAGAPPQGIPLATLPSLPTPSSTPPAQGTPFFDPATASLFPPASALDPTHPSFPTAFQNWSTSALSQLGQLPRLTPSQLSAIAGAAAGVGDAGLFSAAAAAGGVGVGMGMGVGVGVGVGAGAGQGLPIDLPASLAALFEAKLTLDREKAKLMRMQKELKGYREGVAAAVGAGKGKEVAVDDELGECTCGRNG
ncbi:uncharacterized protein EHS24_008549 [Apiotrichum porosum]|uniref:Uncharacterized protein n=1 Tax=Apiotrichum porosum TaxID=105984 RepID=A0A427XQM1_9TREE|nr:uncharacterized protein EHS24_008549 [Apiotrichum porosum]RSH81115.1 hypothetical protein EHS24_008549 [Apiotrichum porosum]